MQHHTSTTLLAKKVSSELVPSSGVHIEVDACCFVMSYAGAASYASDDDEEEEEGEQDAAADEEEGGVTPGYM